MSARVGKTLRVTAEGVTRARRDHVARRGRQPTGDLATQLTHVPESHHFKPSSSSVYRQLAVNKSEHNSMDLRSYLTSPSYLEFVASFRGRLGMAAAEYTHRARLTAPRGASLLYRIVS